MKSNWFIDNEIFHNKKTYIIIISIIAIIIFLICIFCFANKKSKESNYTTLISTDQKFSIELPNSIKYRQNSSPNNDFTIDLYAENDEMFMYATTIAKTRELDLYEVTNNDKISYFRDKENLRDDSRYIRNKSC